MPWREVSIVEQRREFVALASQEGANIRELCRRFGISAPTAYKWRKRGGSGSEGLANRSRRPHHSPGQTPTEVEALVLGIRSAHPTWGGRKLRARLLAQDMVGVPSASTITEILRRHGQIDPVEAAKHQPWQRFERAFPNELWQMDFKGHFATQQGRCHPLTVLDDHSRYCLALEPCANERSDTVQGRLTTVFRLYGLPKQIIADNGGPWGSHTVITELTVWLWQLGVRVNHGRPYHPQTQGKDERFHRTLKAEVLTGQTFLDLADCGRRFAHWREVYNHERPHEALALATPSSRYQVSPRAFPEQLPSIEYDSHLEVRKVQGKGEISFRGKEIHVSSALHGHRVALRPNDRHDDHWDVYFGVHPIVTIDLSGEHV